MKKTNSVKNYLFISNTLMVLITLSLFFIINFIVLKLYFHTIEQQLYVGQIHTLTNGQLEELLENIFLNHNHFYIYFFLDGLICIMILFSMSQVFTKKLTQKITEPLDILFNATERIKKNNLTTPIEYHGFLEYETICHTFNSMQEHLLKAKQMNAQYEKSRHEMIAGISHDLKTPLTVIKGTFKALLDHILTSKEQEEQFIKIAYQRSEDMTQLLNRLLELSQIDQKIPLNITKVHLHSFLQQYIDKRKDLPVDMKLELNNSYDGFIDFDDFQFERILDNLIENSKKYAHCSPLLMTISIKRINDFIDICFHDNGQGVLEENISHLFDEFYREDPSRNLPGHGLGLSIVKNLVEDMNGHVEARNNNGLEIHLFFPIKGVDNNGK